MRITRKVRQGRILRNLGDDATTKDETLTVRLPLSTIQQAMTVALPDEERTDQMRRLILGDLAEALSVGFADRKLRLYTVVERGRRVGGQTYTIRLTPAQKALVTARAKILGLTHGAYLATLIRRAVEHCKT